MNLTSLLKFNQGLQYVLEESTATQEYYKINVEAGAQRMEKQVKCMNAPYCIFEVAKLCMNRNIVHKSGFGKKKWSQ